MHLLKPLVAALGCYALILSQAGCASPVSEQPPAPLATQTAPAKPLLPPNDIRLDEPSASELPPVAFPAGPYLMPTDPVDLAQIEDGLIPTPEYAVSVLQLLFDHEYQAFVELDPSQLDPSSTLGWEFFNADYEFLSGLKDSGAHGVGHGPAQILSVAQVSALPTGDWELTVLTSELGIEIRDLHGAPLLDTRGDGPTMATYTISFAAN